MTILLDNRVRKTAGAEGPTSRLLLVYRLWLAVALAVVEMSALAGALRTPDGG